VKPNHYYSQFKAEAKAFLTELKQAMNVGNYDKSDLQSDYFNVGWYDRVNIGQWNKAYLVTR
jgi:hypothetical protein